MKKTSCIILGPLLFLAACSGGAADDADLKSGIELYYERAGLSSTEGGFTEDSFNEYISCIATDAEKLLSPEAKKHLSEGILPAEGEDVTHITTIVNDCQSALVLEGE